MTKQIQRYSNAEIEQVKRDKAAVNWLISRTLEQVLEGAEAMAKSEGVPMKIDYETHTKPGGGWYRTFRQVLFVRVEDNEKRKSLLARFKPLLLPATDEMMELWLAQLLLVAKRRKQDEMDEAATLALFANALKEYPADIVKDALCPKKWGFWPSLEEVIDLCDPQLRIRKTMIEKLEDLILKHQTPEHREQRPREPTTAERVAHADRIMRECGFRKDDDEQKK